MAPHFIHVLEYPPDHFDSFENNTFWKLVQILYHPSLF